MITQLYYYSLHSCTKDQSDNHIDVPLKQESKDIRLENPTSLLPTEELRQKAKHEEVKTYQQQKDADIKKMHGEKMEASFAFTMAINNLARAIEKLADVFNFPKI